MTGAPMPPGADAVVMVELCTFGDDVVTIAEGVPVGNHVRPVGDDIGAGDVVLTRGSVADRWRRRPAPHARSRHGERRPEAHGWGDLDRRRAGRAGPPSSARVRSTTRTAPRFWSCSQESGSNAVDLGLVADDEAAIEQALRSGVARCDAVLSSGGVSMGDFDFVKVVLDRIGDMDGCRSPSSRRSRSRSARSSEPGAVPVFGLPGNPVSSMVSYELFARPALRRMAGHTELDRPVVHGGRRRRLPATRPTARPTSPASWSPTRPDAPSRDRPGDRGRTTSRRWRRPMALPSSTDGDGVRAGEPVPVMLF